MEERVFIKDLWSIRNIVIVVLTPLILLPVIFTVDGDEAKCAYCVLIMGVFWITEAIPIAATSLLPIILFPMVGLMYAKDVSSQYINDTSMLFLGGLFIAAAIEHWNIHKRMALRILMLVGAEPRWLMFGLMMPTWFLSMWISNTATTAMMIPIANAVMTQLKEVKDSESKTHEIENCEGDHGDVKLELKEKENIIENNYCEGEEDLENIRQNRDRKNHQEYRRLCKAFSLAMAYSANVGGIASLTGTIPNVIMKGQSEIVYQKRNATSPVTFTTWIQYCLPISAILVVLIWIWLQIFFLRCKSFNRRSPGQAKKIKEIIRHEYESLGPLTFGQGAVIGHLVLLAVLWITRDLGGVGGWGKLFPPKTVTDSTPSILISISLFLFPSTLPLIFCCAKERKNRMKVSPLLPWKDAEQRVPWGVIILLGGGFALAKGSQVSGLSSWLGDELSVFKDFDPWMMNLILCYIVAFATEVTSNTAICTLMMPIMAELAMKLHVNPLYFMFPSAIATSFAFMLPVATPPNAVVFSYGYVKVIDMVTAGFVLNIITVPVLVLGTETWGQAIFNFHVLPDIFKTITNGTTENRTATYVSNLSYCTCVPNTTNTHNFTL